MWALLCDERDVVSVQFGRHDERCLVVSDGGLVQNVEIIHAVLEHQGWCVMFLAMSPTLVKYQLVGSFPMEVVGILALVTLFIHTSMVRLMALINTSFS